MVLLAGRLLSALGYVLGTQPPFQGTAMDQLQSTTGFLTAVLAAVGGGAYLVAALERVG